MTHESFASLSITMQCYGWSKYGGARQGLVKTDDKIWYCQCCGEKQVREIPGYMYGLGNREFIRLCAKCWFEIINGSTPTVIKRDIFVKRSVSVLDIGGG